MRAQRRSPVLDYQKLARIAVHLAEPAVQSMIQKSNSEYYHWEEFRHRPLPKGLSAEDAWQLVAFSRSQRTHLALRDVKQMPFAFWLPDQAQQWIHYIDRHAGITPDESTPDLEGIRERVVIDSLMEEAIATSQLEGAATTRKVAKEMLRAGREPRDQSERMIANGYRTITMLRERLNEPLTLEFIHDIQESMTRDTLDDPRDARRLRQEEDQVRVIDTRDGEDVYVPPPAGQLPERLVKLLEFANHSPDHPPFMHPIIRGIIIHFWLAYEHPYADGNGRTARALFYWYVLKRKYWAFEYLAISRIIHAAPMKYYRAFLHTETDSNDLTYFVMFHLQVAYKAIEQMRKQLTEIKAEQFRLSRVRLAADLNERQRALLTHALKHPAQVYSIEGHQRSQGSSYETARSDLLVMKAKGLLVEVGRRRPREFMPSPELPNLLNFK